MARMTISKITYPISFRRARAEAYHAACSMLVNTYAVIKQGY